MSSHFFIAPDVATFIHVQKYLLHHPGATLIDIMQWVNGYLTDHFPWAIVTDETEAMIVAEVAKQQKELHS